jgi:hypothetical protein
LYDKAKPHLTKCLKKYFKSDRIISISHSLYSPDLALYNMWLFDKIIDNLSYHSRPKSLKKQITEVLLSIPKEDYLLTFNKYLERMQHCINNHGGYFEHLLK